MDVYRHIAQLMVDMELKAQKKQVEYFKPLKEPKRLPYDLEVLLPKIYIAKPDRAKLLAVFVELSKDKLFLHLVFNNEHFPISASIDRAYRELRKKAFGRVADVESVEISLLDKAANFVTTYCGPNVYETSVHFDGREPYRGAIFIDTWNHLMSCIPPLPIAIRYGFRLANKYEVYKGTRKDAEEYAKLVG